MTPMSPSESLIAVVDDDVDVCRSIARALSTHGYRVRTFTSARAYLDEREAIDPTCLLADIRMPDVDGLAMQRVARDIGLDVPTVFMTATGDVSTIVQAMKTGASDLLAKPFSPQQLFAAIGVAVDRARRTRSERRSLAELWRSLARLTPREAEVGALVASGRLNKQVAAIIGTTEKTVKVHRARVMQKLRAKSLAELVRIVDHVLSDPNCHVLMVDGKEINRPRALDIIARVLGRGTPAATKA